MNNLQTLLIVDDSQLNRELLMEILGTDYRYLQAEDGQQAIDILRGNPAVDLMLLDMVMPGLDGCGVLEIMQRYDWLDEIPVIVRRPVRRLYGPGLQSGRYRLYSPPVPHAGGPPPDREHADALCQAAAADKPCFPAGIG